MKENETYKWYCVICEKEMKIGVGSVGDSPGSLDPAEWPNVEGGLFSLHFGWPSHHDDMNLYQCSHKEWQGCICDECFEAKKHLMRHIKETKLGSKWEIISEKD